MVRALSQSNGAIYDEEGGVISLHNRKIEALDDIIESANGKPLMIAYWFRHDRDRIIERLEENDIRWECLDNDRSILRR